ncbi:MAG: hypothetical protein ACOVVK_06475 [Elsteraceae bacterium]
MEQVRTIEGEVDDIKDRLSSTGDTVVEMLVSGGGGMEKCIAYSEKAKVLQNLLEKMRGLVSRNNVSHIRDLKVRVEINGIVKNQSGKDLIVTGIKIVQ